MQIVQYLSTYVPVDVLLCYIKQIVSDVIYIYSNT